MTNCDISYNRLNHGELLPPPISVDSTAATCEAPHRALPKLTCVRLGRSFFRLFNFKRKPSDDRADRIALEIAARYGLTAEYREGRQCGLTPIEALEDWDMMKPEDYQLFEE
jgi:hypothetical protein